MTPTHTAAARPDSSGASAIPALTGAEPFFIVHNAGSGRSSTDEVRATIERILTEAGRRYEIFTVEDPRQLTATASRALQAAQREQGVVVAAGGDGTLNAVAQVVLGHGVPFGILPQGTFNYFGRTYSISQDTEASTRSLLDAVIKPVQLGMLNDKVFLVNASLGMYPTLLEDREAFKQKYGRSRLVALWSGLVTLFRTHRRLRLHIELEGQPTILRTPTLVVGNNALQLEHIGVEATDALERGRLVAMGSKTTGTLALYKLLLLGLISRLGEADDVFNFDFARMVVEPHRRGRVKVAMDGEISHMRTPLVFTVAPHALPLLVPRDPQSRDRQ